MSTNIEGLTQVWESLNTNRNHIHHLAAGSGARTIIHLERYDRVLNNLSAVLTQLGQIIHIEQQMSATGGSPYINPDQTRILRPIREMKP